MVDGYITLSEYQGTQDGGPWEIRNGGYTFTFGGTANNPPLPESVDKSSKCEWRHRHTGTGNFEKKWWRHRRTEIISFKGKFLNLENEVSTGGATSKRLALEAIVTRNSIWKMLIVPDGSKTVLQSPTLINSDGGQGSAVIVSTTNIVGATADTATFYIITDSSFNLSPGKKTIDYSITFERVGN